MAVVKVFKPRKHFNPHCKSSFNFSIDNSKLCLYTIKISNLTYSQHPKVFQSLNVCPKSGSRREKELHLFSPLASNTDTDANDKLAVTISCSTLPLIRMLIGTVGLWRAESWFIFFSLEPSGLEDDFAETLGWSAWCLDKGYAFSAENHWLI